MIARAVLARRDVAAAIFDDHFHHERDVVGQRRDHMVLVDDIDIGIGLDIGAGDHARRVFLDGDDARRLAMILDDQRLDVEDDVGHVFEHAGNGGEFVLGAADLDLRDRAAFQAGQEHAPQAVADGHAEAALEGLGHKLAVCARQGGGVNIDDAGKLETAPTNVHRFSPCWV